MSTSFLDMSEADIDRMLEIPHVPLELTLRLESEKINAKKQWWKFPIKWGFKWNRKGWTGTETEQ